MQAGAQWNGLDNSILKSIDVQAIAIDGANGQQLLADAMKDARIRAPILPTVKDVIAAYATFDQRLATKEICHMGQPSMTQSVTNCEKRTIGSNGGFGYKSINDAVDISLLDSMVLAQWVCGTKTRKVKRQQRASC